MNNMYIPQNSKSNFPQGQYTDNVPVAVPKSLPIPDAMERLEETSRMLYEVVASLEKQLSPIMDEIPTNNAPCGNDVKPKENIYTLAQHINIVNNSIYTQCQLIQSLKDRLAI